jgi:diguanylate cyclase (GGDEF)-like protein/PAS domain S-box-containing protein
VVDCNQKLIELLNVPPEILSEGDENVALKYFAQVLEDPNEIFQIMQDLAKHPEKSGNLSDAKFKDGRIVERYSQPQIVNGKIVGRVFSFRDVTEKRKAEEELRLRNRAIESSTQGVIITNSKDGKIIYCNPAFEKITGYKPEEVLGRTVDFLTADDKDQAEIKSIHLAYKELRDEMAVLRSYRKDGTLFWNEMRLAPVVDPSNQVKHFVGIIDDITERKAMEEQLIHQATHDALTDLPNRILLKDRIHQITLFARREKSIAAVLFLDLDRFKYVNDSLGHQVGDDLLCAVASRLSKCLRDTDSIARIGGDEFVIILSPLQSERDGMRVAQKLLEEVKKPFHLEGRELSITTSIGISCYPKDGLDAESLIRNSDTAMYQAKDNGRDTFQFFTDDMNKRVTERLLLENNLRRALEREEFEMWYQPVVDLKTEKIIGVEALLRWDHPQRGYISPLEFVPMAEEIGLIIPLGNWIMETACRQQLAWEKHGLPSISMSINVSGRQLQQDSFVEEVSKVLQKTKINPNNIVLELTESMLMDPTPEFIVKLESLKKLGIQLAIDDFGTGYSSLGYLKRLPVDKIKIDRVFIHDVHKSPDSSAIAMAIIAMSKSLKLRVVAEGAEQKEEIQFLKKFQCDEVQGYYFSKPIKSDACEQLIRENYNLPDA